MLDVLAILAVCYASYYVYTQRCVKKQPVGIIPVDEMLDQWEVGGSHYADDLRKEMQRRKQLKEEEQYYEMQRKMIGKIKSSDVRTPVHHVQSNPACSRPTTSIGPQSKPGMSTVGEMDEKACMEDGDSRSRSVSTETDGYSKVVLATSATATTNVPKGVESPLAYDNTFDPAAEKKKEEALMNAHHRRHRKLPMPTLYGPATHVLKGMKDDHHHPRHHKQHRSKDGKMKTKPTTVSGEDRSVDVEPDEAPHAVK